MALKYEEGYWYGCDEYKTYIPGGYYVESDISGEELEEYDIYYYNGKYCSKKELIKLLGYINLENEIVECELEEMCKCGAWNIYYHPITKELFCEDCIDEEISDYKVKLEDLYDN